MEKIVAYIGKYRTLYLNEKIGNRTIISTAFKKEHYRSGLVDFLTVRCVCEREFNCFAESFAISSNYDHDKYKYCSACVPKRTTSQITYKEISTKYFSTIKHGAKSRNLELTITTEDIHNLWILQNKKCALSGLRIDFYKSNDIKNTASVDRIDSNKGYLLDNIQIVHKDLNKMKMEFSQEHFIAVCKLVAKNHE